MTRDEFKKFLTEGALLGEPDGRLRLFVGPFKRFSTRPPGDVISLFCTDFFLSEPTPWWVAESSVVLTRQEVIEHCLDSSELVKGALSHLDWSAPSKDKFAPVFHTIQADIQAGELGKAVPVVFEKACSESGPSPEEKRRWLASLAQLPKTLYPYGVWDESYLMLGASPELLFQKSPGTTVETMALAGTLPKNEVSSRKSLLDDPKEMEEHTFVINDIKARLEALGRVQKSQTGLLELPTLFHLCTRMSLETENDLDFEDLVRTLHPTPALGLFPRESGWARLQSYSMGPRRSFGAPFGAYIGPDNYRCLVAIRKVQWYEGHLWLGSGCGVVRQSELDREWQELIVKRQSVKQMLGLEQHA